MLRCQMLRMISESSYCQTFVPGTSWMLPDRSHLNNNGASPAVSKTQNFCAENHCNESSRPRKWLVGSIVHLGVGRLRLIFFFAVSQLEFALMPNPIQYNQYDISAGDFV